MEYRHKINDEQWEKIKDHLPGKDGDAGRSGTDNRLFIDAVIWIARSGAPWRDLPKDFGNWSNVHKRFTRWSKNGVWQQIFNTLAVGPDTEWLMIDSTIVKVHQHGAGAQGKKKSKHWTIQRRFDEQNSHIV